MTKQKLYFEDVKGDEELPSTQLTITRTHIVKYIGAGGDFFPIHHDEEFAKSVGLPSVFANGLMHGGMLTRIITDWAGNGKVKRYKIRFATMVWPGDTLTFAGRAVKKYQQGEENLVDCELSVVNQKGEAAITGEATVSLPSRQ
ncbi:MAG: MaoC/PaaZ C-terminal domain-containing protein [Syntrophales bacterium]|jgi:acyl dehydratase